MASLTLFGRLELLKCFIYLCHRPRPPKVLELSLHKGELVPDECVNALGQDSVLSCIQEAFSCRRFPTSNVAVSATWIVIIIVKFYVNVRIARSASQQPGRLHSLHDPVVKPRRLLVWQKAPARVLAIHEGFNFLQHLCPQRVCRKVECGCLLGGFHHICRKKRDH